jgi:hypothetical protein
MSKRQKLLERVCNIQRSSDGKAKPYQVDQVLEAIDGAR